MDIMDIRLLVISLKFDLFMVLEIWSFYGPGNLIFLWSWKFDLFMALEIWPFYGPGNLIFLWSQHNFYGINSNTIYLFGIFTKNIKIFSSTTIKTNSTRRIHFIERHLSRIITMETLNRKQKNKIDLFCHKVEQCDSAIMVKWMVQTHYFHSPVDITEN